MYQKTIRRRIECSGVGLHSGKQVKLIMRPATENTGIVFHVAGPEGVKDIYPKPDVVIATGLATTLGQDGVAVSTVEHLLATLRGLGVDNIHIEASGGEIPILDGSAAPFIALLSEAGLRVQRSPRKVYRIKKSVRFRQDGKSITAEPYSGFSVDYTINFPHPAIGVQRMVLEVTPQSFARVAKARTFGFLQDVEMLQSRGLALGGSLDNAVILDKDGIVNKEGLRYADEFVRHKLLDFIGDMAMLPMPLQGRFTVSCSGHALNNQFLRHLMENESSCLARVTLGQEQSAPAFRVIPSQFDGVAAFAG